MTSACRRTCRFQIQIVHSLQLYRAATHYDRLNSNTLATQNLQHIHAFDYLMSVEGSVEHTERLPISIDLTTSAPICARSGEPPFKVFITHECTSKGPIWALVRIYLQNCHGVIVRDPERNHRRIGPPSTQVVEFDDDHAYDLEDTELIRLEAGQNFTLEYTFSTGPKANGLVPSDMHKLVAGKTYEIVVRGCRWRWMFEYEMPKSIDQVARRKLLGEKRPATWDADCLISFEAAE